VSIDYVGVLVSNVEGKYRRINRTRLQTVIIVASATASIVAALPMSSAFAAEQKPTFAIATVANDGAGGFVFPLMQRFQPTTNA
jgi:hypothetical protein